MTNITDVARATKEYKEGLEDIRSKRDKYWALLQKLKKEYTGICNESSEVEFSFAKYVEANYGIVIQYDNQGLIRGDFEISNPSKYTFCLLKHT
jgi:hypothetical protein